MKNNTIPIGSLILFKTSKRSKARLGRVSDFNLLNGSMPRYKIERRVTGKFLDDITEYVNGNGSYTVCTKWCFFMWMKPERILRIVEK